MGNQKFDFEAFTSLYNRAVEGLQDAQAAMKALPEKTNEVAAELGSAKFKTTSDSFNESCDAMVATFQSVFDAAEEVKKFYAATDAGLN